MREMDLIRFATAVAATAMAAPAFAADIAEPVPVDTWEFYIGVHAGAVWGHGDWEDTNTNEADLEGTRGIFGALAGINYRFDSAFVGLEGDVGFATGSFDWKGDFNTLDGCGNGTWCDMNGHVRLRAGIAVADGLDLFVAGGVALADGNGDDDDAVYFEALDETFVGWSLGFGADYAVTDHFKLRVEYLYDDYGDRHHTEPDSNYNSDSDWADNTVRGAAIFQF